VKILIHKIQKQKVFLQNWANENGWEIKSNDSFSTSKFSIDLLNNLPNNCDSLLWADCDISSQADVKLLDEFIKQDDDINFSYYSPRPNEYLDVDSPALILIKSIKKVRKEFHQAAYQNKIHSFARKIVNAMPENLSAYVKKTIRTLKRNKIADNDKLNFIKSNENSLSKLESAITTSIPNLLRFLSVDWKNWTPSTALFNSDVINRFEEFFPNPRGIHVILLNKCNLECGMCPYHSPKIKPHHTSNYFDDYRAMDFAVFAKIADYAANNNVALQFGQIEEPLMHKKIFDYFSYAKKIGVKQMHITTNGTLLNNERADLLADSGVTSVMFSVDAATASVYKEIRGADLEALEKNVEYFVVKAKERGIKVWASFILQEESRHERDIFLSKWRDLGIDYVTFYVLTEHDPKTGAFIRTEELYEKGGRYPCAAPWIQSVVFPEGEVSLCCKTMTDVGWRGVVSVGSLKDNSFDEIWRSPSYMEVRKELLKNKFEQFEVCQNCEIWSASTSKTEITNEYIRNYNETMETYEFLDVKKV
jgi:radical SAM protein with 4Fe4S-binding SPASM domain